MKETWEFIRGYEGYYQISNLGNVRSVDRVVIGKDGSLNKKIGVIKTKRLGNSGYLYVSLYKNNEVKNRDVHRLVAETFLDIVDGKHYVNHINGNKKDNSINNLEYVTQTENIHHYWNKTYNKKRGAYFDKRSSKWYSTIRANGKYKRLGTFSTKEEAYGAFYTAYKNLYNENPWEPEE